MSIKTEIQKTLKILANEAELKLDRAVEKRRIWLENVKKWRARLQFKKSNFWLNI